MSCQMLTLEEGYVSAADTGDCQLPGCYSATQYSGLRESTPYSHSIVAGGLPEIS
jgi:hypothetical protein